MLTDDVLARVRQAVPPDWTVSRERDDAVFVSKNLRYARVFSIGPVGEANPEEVIDYFIRTVADYTRAKDAE